MFRLIYVTLCVLSSIAAPAQYLISGVVQQLQTSSPLPNATVQLLPTDRFVITDGNGRFTFDNVPAGNYTLLTRYLGHYEKSMQIIVPDDKDVTITLTESPLVTDEVIVQATRAENKTPTTYTDLGKEEIASQNFGQDLPYLLNWTPSLVTTSDAGTGIGYTGLRIRGSDATRINVTINGIPYNDSESLGTFWVDIPDISSSSESIQIQRGIGTSTNGAGSFGGTVNLETSGKADEPFAEATMSIGSFNTQRYSASAGTGLINDHWSVTGRFSKISSEGYIDRASSDLQSYYLSGSYHSRKSILKAIFFGGREVTYQSWYGIDDEQMKINRTFNYAGAIYDEAGNVARYYDNQTDNFKQDHTQLHFTHALSSSTTLSAALHYTFGRGYYEEYNQDTDFGSLGLQPLTVGDSLITQADFVTRKWLRNHFYGTTFSLHHSRGKVDLILGGGYHRYAPGYHFGEIVWGEFSPGLMPGQRFYEGESDKSDLNIYTKLNYALTDRWSGFIDLQYRRVDYTSSGIDDDQSAYNIGDQLNFFNPKAGLVYTLDEKNTIYASYAVANREPVRTDYLENTERPRPERMGNLEAGWRKTTDRYDLTANYYLMHYTDQLVLTGALDNVGNPIRANVGKSYRTGIELTGMLRLASKIDWGLNVTWSRNRNLDYVWEDQNNETRTMNTAIILSPEWIAGSQITLHALEQLDISLLSKFVDKQYLDNTENDALTLDSYFVNDLKITWRLLPRGTKGVEVSLLINNLLDAEYSSNGYSYGNIPYFYPQAGVNLLGRLAVKL